MGGFHGLKRRYELGYHRPEELGPFLQGYVERKFGEAKRRRAAVLKKLSKALKALEVDPNSQDLMKYRAVRLFQALCRASLR